MYPLIYYNILIYLIFNENAFFYFKGVQFLNELHGLRRRGGTIWAVLDMHNGEQNSFFADNQNRIPTNEYTAKQLNGVIMSISMTTALKNIHDIDKLSN